MQKKTEEGSAKKFAGPSSVLQKLIAAALAAFLEDIGPEAAPRNVPVRKKAPGTAGVPHPLHTSQLAADTGIPAHMADSFLHMAVGLADNIVYFVAGDTSAGYSSTHHSSSQIPA